MNWKISLSACLGFALVWPGMAAALVVDVQGVKLQPELEGASCVEITGDYPGVRIEADQPGTVPRVCHNASRVNSLTIVNATLIALDPVKKEVLLQFEHEFPPGVNGKIMARAKLQGFFATRNGVGIPKGDKLRMEAYFSQAGNDDAIGDPLNVSVGDSLDSALVEYSVKKQYLIAGPRTLKGKLKIQFAASGHKLTFPGRCTISLDTGSTLEDRLETMEVLDEEEVPAEDRQPPAGVEPSLTPPVVPEIAPLPKPGQSEAPRTPEPLPAPVELKP